MEAGGATVFPAVGAVIAPQKGSAAFWYNLHPNGQGNLMTLHAACPVLIGSKWGTFSLFRLHTINHFNADAYAFKITLIF